MKSNQNNKELKIVFVIALIYFAVFLIVPIASLLGKSFQTPEGIGIGTYMAVLSEKGILTSLKNSFAVSGASALVTTALAFILSYGVHYTRIPGWFKKIICGTARLPMLLPTIVYGFAIIYSFGKKGLLTQLLGIQLFDIYGLGGLMTGYVIYTLPVSFLLIHNAMQYVDKSFTVVSRLMSDRPGRNFYMTVFRPLTGAIMSSVIQTFFLCFTDFGIPAAVGGEYSTIAGVLYNEMLGSVPDFGRGAVIALVMLLPSVGSVIILHILEKYNIRYNKISQSEISKGRVRDCVLGISSLAIVVSVLAVFAVIFVVPFVSDWPYNITFTLKHIIDVFSDNVLLHVMKNSILAALLTALFGTLAAYAGALITARSNMPKAAKSVMEGLAMVTNTIPGMVLGLAYLFVFSGSFMQGTLAIIVVCNIVHFFSTPYIMLKGTLSKLNASWETTAMLCGDSWLKTVLRVVVPNTRSSIVEVFGYYFMNSMVTISAVIFIAGARTMVITTKIKELQYYNKYSEIFVLALLLLAVNFLAKTIFNCLAEKKQSKRISNCA